MRKSSFSDKGTDERTHEDSWLTSLERLYSLRVLSFNAENQSEPDVFNERFGLVVF